MANFDEEFNRIIFVEGGYVNDKDDSDTKYYRINSLNDRSTMLRDMVKFILDFFIFEINLHYPIDVIVISVGGLY